MWGSGRSCAMRGVGSLSTMSWEAQEAMPPSWRGGDRVPTRPWLLAGQRLALGSRSVLACTTFGESLAIVQAAAAVS